jgi:hypothetical protein
LILACGCDADPADAGTNSGPGGKSDSSQDGGCEEGFELVDSSSECYADAPCYEIPGQGWCTGSCPWGQELDDAFECVAAQCLPGFEVVNAESECLQDAPCYPLGPQAWCTGGCENGATLEFNGDSGGWACIPGCLDGFELVPNSTSCLQDAPCYELPGSGWCTGSCPFGQRLGGTGDVPACVDEECLAGFELVPSETECLQDAPCYELGPQGWCTGGCPNGGELVHYEFGWACT